MCNNDAMYEDFMWFLHNYDQISKDYNRKYVVVKNKQIIGAYDTYADGVSNTKQVEDLGTFIVQYCDGTEDAYTAQILLV